MKMWKRYVVSALAIVMVAAMSFYLPRIYGEAAQEEPTAETESVETELLETEPSETELLETEPSETEPLESEPLETAPPETEPPETLDNAGGATDDNMNPPKLPLVPRELTDEELKDELRMEFEVREGSMTVTDAVGGTLQLDGEWYSGTMDTTFRGFKFAPSYRLVFRAVPSSAYRITGDIGTKENYFAWCGELYEKAYGSGIESILVTRDGISLQGTNMSCEIYRNEEHSDHKTILRTENASRAVLKYEDGQFLLWSDGAYSIEVYDNWSGATLLGKEVEADSVFCVQDVSSDAPTCHRVDTAE